MLVMDPILVGNSTIGNYVVGFFNCQSNDGETAEDAILHTYKVFGYQNVKPYWHCGCLEGVIHDSMDRVTMVATADFMRAMKHLEETCGDDLSNRIEQINKHRVNNFVRG